MSRHPVRKRLALAVGLLLFVFAPMQPTRADGLLLSGQKFWVVAASRNDPDAAIGVARNLQGLNPQVVLAANGWYAAIAGPYDVRPGEGHAFLDKLAAQQSFPKDSYFTKGASFTKIVWTRPATHVTQTLEYDGEKPVSLQAGDLKVTLTRQRDGEDGFDPVAVGTWKGKAAFRLVETEHPADKPASRIQLVRLDPASPLPQVVFTYFWQGAHCCVVTKIASLQSDGAWQIIDGDDLDGGDGYMFEDLGNKGFSDLVSIDQSFLYAFSSYADSNAPLRIQQLKGNALVDVTRDPAFRHRILQELAMGASPTDGGEVNGYLGGFVANSILVGNGPAAWAKMLESYDHNSDFAEETCLDAKPVESCPEKRKAKLSFPYSLREHLVAHGYLKDVRDYPVAQKIEASETAPTK